jgi:hypothetical protein
VVQACDASEAVAAAGPAGLGEQGVLVVVDEIGGQGVHENSSGSVMSSSSAGHDQVTSAVTT